MDYRSGLDRLISKNNLIIKLKNKNIGLITNQSGLTRDYRRNIDIFNNRKIVNLKAIFAPEHGYTGAARDRAFVESTIDQGSGLPIYSLYGDSRKPERDILSRIEVLIFDIQDIGLRYYTFISTLFLVMESCADFDMPLLILDRMNPLGRKVEGWLLEEDFSSFEGLYPLVHRHGMTVGELALWAKKEKELDINLEIIKLKGWTGELFSEYNRVWIPPSPNIPHFSSCLTYKITYMIEGSNVSEGRGTTKPFDYIGAPWINGHLLAGELNQTNLDNISFRAVDFIPSFSKYQGQLCSGVHVIVDKPDLVESNLIGLTIINKIRELYPEYFTWIKHKGDNRYFFDLLMGTDFIRKELEAGCSPAEIIKKRRSAGADFNVRRQQFLLY